VAVLRAGAPIQSQIKIRSLCVWILVTLLASATALAQSSTGRLQGRVTDDSGAPLPGASVSLLRQSNGVSVEVPTSRTGDYSFNNLEPGRYTISISLINFATLIRRDIEIGTGGITLNAVMHLAVNAEVTVTAARTFANLADIQNPAENLVGVAQSASQGAITAEQLEARPLMRTGEVLETVPGVITTQHSGEGKANQYFLRGFNLDHGTDFAQMVAGMPVNLPSHAHGQGYSDLNFMIPELVSGVQFSKGPYFAEQGDFATAGSSNINYVTSLDRPLAHVDSGGEGYRRVVVAASPAIDSGHLLAAFEGAHNDGPWTHPDAYDKVNGVIRYSHGNSINGLVLTATTDAGTRRIKCRNARSLRGSSGDSARSIQAMAATRIGTAVRLTGNEERLKRSPKSLPTASGTA
jgi:Carboxypeptidase regulatory-like domain/TonB-dependent Receptor Plug Domain